MPHWLIIALAVGLMIGIDLTLYFMFGIVLFWYIFRIVLEIITDFGLGDKFTGGGGDSGGGGSSDSF